MADGTATKRPGEAWQDKIDAIEPTAAGQWPAGAVVEPHNGVDSDANLHYHDLMADPDPEFDPMANYTPPVEETPADGAE